jgi:hypothetical protein
MRLKYQRTGRYTMRDDGGPAFPRTGEGVGNKNYDVPGMTVRQWYKGMAIMGKADVVTNDAAIISWAHYAGLLADALMAEDREVHDD